MIGLHRCHLCQRQVDEKEEEHVDYHYDKNSAGSTIGNHEEDFSTLRSAWKASNSHRHETYTGTKIQPPWVMMQKAMMEKEWKFLYNGLRLECRNTLVISMCAYLEFLCFAHPIHA